MIKVQDVAFVRFAAPDFDAMERFLADFGLEAERHADGKIYARGTDPVAYIHVTEPGEAGFRGVAFEAASAADLAAAALLPGASAVEPLPGPAGGERVRFTDPDGFSVEIVHGRAAVEARPVEASLVNRGSSALRHGTLHRPARGPATVKRLGHVVLRVSDFAASAEWYQSRFGFLVTDEVPIPDTDRILTSFMRCDRGEEYTDHHTLLCVGVGEPGFDHAAFEVEDIDAVMAGHDHLVAAGYEHHAGVGRHVLGSQIFDYWRDPWGHVVEHYTDGDLVNASHKTERHDPVTALGTQWGKFV